MNPLKESRLRAGLTQKSLAAKTDMTPHAILRYEQGLYESLSPKLVLFATDQLGLLPSEVEKQYKATQLERRDKSAQYLDPFPHLVMDQHEHPFVFFRNAVTMRAVGKKTRVGFCVLLAMNPAVVIQYERGKTKHLPPLIMDCLFDCRCPEGKIKDLDSYGEIWHERYGGND